MAIAYAVTPHVSAEQDCTSEPASKKPSCNQVKANMQRPLKQGTDNHARETGPEVHEMPAVPALVSQGWGGLCVQEPLQSTHNTYKGVAHSSSKEYEEGCGEHHEPKMAPKKQKRSNFAKSARFEGLILQISKKCIKPYLSKNFCYKRRSRYIRTYIHTECT